MKLDKIIRLIHTIRFLKLKQFRYRAYYLIRNKMRKLGKFTYPEHLDSSAKPLFLKEGVYVPVSLEGRNFTFLNQTHTFEDTIDWNFNGYGKLWNYNLTYFDFLTQKNISKEQGLEIIYDFIDYDEVIRGSIMPFPIALRGINWIKFLSQYQIEDKKIDDTLYAQYTILMDNIEYHILGNHLLENGFSLLFGAYYFQDEKMYQKASYILQEELKEQILKDGAHFELSPMYHQIMLFRVLDCINVVEHNDWKNQELLVLLSQKAEMMLGWLNEISFSNGKIPLFNDSANKIAPSTKKLNAYAQRLGIASKKISLSESGYRKKVYESYECIVDVGNIGPDYIPGHAHSDTFNFELYIHNKPIIVDTGLSTYESGERRTLERSTISHNTIEIDNLNQTEVWGGFRVARRAKIIDLKENKDNITATHDGYKKIGCLHTREWKFSDEKIVISDTVLGNHGSATAYMHFHPEVEVSIIGKHIIADDFKITFSDTFVLSQKEYNYSSEFNTYQKATVIAVEFKNQISMEIDIE